MSRSDPKQKAEHPDSSHRTRVAWGKGKREVLLFKSEINDLFAEGATIEEVYQTLSDRLSVSKTTFRYYAAALRKAAAQPNPFSPVQKPKATFTPVAAKADDGEPPSTFSYDPSATDEGLW